MAEVTSILATAAAYDTYQQQQNQNRRIQQQKKDKLERQKQHTLATNRARQYASGIGGRSAENIRDDVRNRYDHAIGNVAGAGDNTLGRINLLAKSARTWGKL